MKGHADWLFFLCGLASFAPDRLVPADRGHLIAAEIQCCKLSVTYEDKDDDEDDATDYWRSGNIS